MKRLPHWIACVAGSALLLGGVAAVHAEPPAGKNDMLAGPKVKAPDDAPGNRRSPGDRDGRGFDGQRKHHAGPLQGLLRDLKLTDEQKTQVRDIAEEHRKEADQFRKDHEQEVKKLHEEIKALHEKIKAIREQGPKPQQMLGDIRKVLTDEQRKEFDARVEKMKQRMEERREHPQGRRAPGGPGGPGSSGGPVGLLQEDERAKLKDMTPEERRSWMQDHRDELRQRAQKRRGERGRGGDNDDAPPPPPADGKLDI